MTADDLRAIARRHGRALGFGATTSAFYAAMELHRKLAPPDARDAVMGRYRDRWLDVVLRLFGVDLTVVPGRPAPATRARLVVSNHRSALDIGVLLSLFGGSIVSRADLASWPLIGAVARAGGVIFVDREAGSSRVAAAKAIRRRLASRGTVILFAEGTTFEGDEVRPFHPGAFGAARDLDVEVVPVGMAYEPGAEFGDETFLAHLGRTASRPGTRVVACVGAPSTLGGDARAEAPRLRDEVQRLVREARAVHDAGARESGGSA